MVSTVETTSTVVVSILVVVLVLTVRIRFEWCRPVPILHPSTLPFGLVGGSRMAAPVVAYILLIGFPTPKSEIIPTTNERKSSSLVFPSERCIVALLELLPTVSPNRKLRTHKRR